MSSAKKRVSPPPSPNGSQGSQGSPLVPTATYAAPKPQRKRATCFQMLRLAYIIVVFISGCLAIVYSQLLTKIFFCNDPDRRQTFMDFTKKNFVILLTYLTSVASPTELVFSFDGSEELKKSVLFDAKANVYKIAMDPKAVLIANHQIYTDWSFIWFIAYLNDCAGQFFIVMKKSLEKIPIIGWGMKNYDFIFLSRNWEADKVYMKKKFDYISTMGAKCWLLIFPEGTNMSSNTIQRSDNYAAKANLTPTKYVLLPRARGLYLACKSFGKVTDTIYDITIGYSGHTRDQYAQDIYTLSRVFLLGKGPKTVSIHISELHTSSIPDVDFSKDAAPLTSAQEDAEIQRFDKWLTKLWYKKEQWMGQFYDTGKFPIPDGREYHVPLHLVTNWEMLYIYIIPFLSWFFGFVAYWITLFLIGLTASSSPDSLGAVTTAAANTAATIAIASAATAAATNAVQQ